MKLFYDLLIWLVGKQMAPGRIKLYMSFIYFKHFNYRYMMLIEDKDKIYMLDRNNNVFQINHLWFPENSDCTKYLTNTLIDGVCF